jgi:hypothetical protein
MFVTPVRISFYIERANFAWDIIDWSLDGIFFLDLIFNFFTPYMEEDKLITSLWQIAKNYLKFWFIIDLLSVIPFELIMDGGKAFTLVRISRLPKLYKLIRLIKMLRTMSAAHNQNNFWSQLVLFLQKNPSSLDRLQTSTE